MITGELHLAAASMAVLHTDELLIGTRATLEENTRERLFFLEFGE